VAGLGAEVLAPSTVVALSGGIGLLAVVLPLLALRRAPGPARAEPATEPEPQPQPQAAAADRGDAAHVASGCGPEGRSVP
jgi:hypothetical protein